MTPRDGEQRSPWHALPAEAALEALQATPRGLTAEAARQRIARHGVNELPPPARRGILLGRSSVWMNKRTAQCSATLAAQAASGRRFAERVMPKSSLNTGLWHDGHWRLQQREEG